MEYNTEVLKQVKKVHMCSGQAIVFYLSKTNLHGSTDTIKNHMSLKHELSFLKLIFPCNILTQLKAYFLCSFNG